MAQKHYGPSERIPSLAEAIRNVDKVDSNEEQKKNADIEYDNKDVPRESF